MRPVRKADNLATLICRLPWNLGASTSWNPQGLYRPVQGQLYLCCMTRFTLIHMDEIGQDTNGVFTRYLSHRGWSLGRFKNKPRAFLSPSLLAGTSCANTCLSLRTTTVPFPRFPLALCSNGQILWKWLVIFHVAFLHWQRFTFLPPEYDDIPPSTNLSFSHAPSSVESPFIRIYSAPNNCIRYLNKILQVWIRTQGVIFACVAGHERHIKAILFLFHKILELTSS